VVGWRGINRMGAIIEEWLKTSQTNGETNNPELRNVTGCESRSGIDTCPYSIRRLGRRGLGSNVV